MTIEALVGFGSPSSSGQGSSYVRARRAWGSGVHKTGRRLGLFVLHILPLGLLVLDSVLVLLSVGHGGTLKGSRIFHKLAIIEGLL
jgi:hypothetical protein